ncbi:MAG TPA: methylcrotonoyl-CoA carboxylase [Planctomycetales bacterium]|jgi:acetyl-CoA carboxylase carboxyltransferase component|nr:methylcrotonoyl-CoA carboxylase [Planctomycetales bacterium]
MSDELASKVEALRREEKTIREGGGAKAIDRQHAKDRLTARERIARLIDPGADFFELGLWAAWNMYRDWGGAPSAGVVTGVGPVAGRLVMVVANDATVKAGAFFPMTCKKVLRAQRIALENRLPLVYLVDSAGVFLPLQDEVFPDEDDFGRIFRNNAVISATGVPQFAAILGNCVAGGGYLPVLCDKLLMTEGSGLYLAGPALVKAAIGQTVSHEDLGGAAMHAAISGTIDFREPNEESCLERLRRLVGLLAPDAVRVSTAVAPGRAPADLLQLYPAEAGHEYDIRDLLPCLLDAGPFDEYKAEYGQTLVCGYGRLGGHPIGVVANQRKRVRPAEGPLQFGGVLYVDSADKAARFIMDCNQTRVPLLFLQDVNGFMVGRDSEHAGIIKAGAKLVNVIANSVVPKITVILGGSFGAGHYALCGKAFDPRFIFAWPTARYAVMGGEQAATTMLDVTLAALRRGGHEPEAEEMEVLRRKVEASYNEETDVRYAAARLWVDKIITPDETRAALLMALAVAVRYDDKREFKTGVLQV